MEQTGGTVYGYDDNGNTTTETLDGVVKTYHHDGRNKLIRVEVDGVVDGEYTYNHNGIRTSKTEGGTTTHFIIDENTDYAQVLEEVVGGTAQVHYTYGHDLINQDRAGATSFYHYDGLGSTRALSDASGSLTDTYDYEAFGEVLEQTGETENSYLYTGEQFDAGLNQYYLRARYYDQTIGRFSQMDAWMGNNHDPITLHKYLYANADPVTYVDPTGNFGIGGFGVSLNIQGVLATANVVSTGYSLFQLATGEEELTARQVGSAILFNMLGGAGGKVIGLFGKKFSKKFDELGCSRNSFVNGTLVHTSDGLVAIEDIRIGDQVWASNPETGEMELRDVTHLIIGEQEYSLVDIKFESGENLKSTLEHPFYSGGKWIEAGELQVGDFVSTVGGLESTVVEVTLLDRSTTVYNLTVEGLHTYHVGEAGYLVHNTNIICDANVTAFFPKLNFGGLVQNRRLGDLTHNEIYNAFVRSAYKPSSHAIMRLREKRTKDLGFNTLNDVARIFNRGKKVSSRDGTVAFQFEGLEAVVNPKTMVIITIKPR